ncbi:MAG: hypothetical protein JWO56_2283 [Acidobacteria bacterium]|nr:hypothetical protein [Acidobacteriota bacterium]
MSPNHETPNLTQPPAADPAALIAQIRAMRDAIPEYTQLPVSARQSLHAVAATDPEFIRASINSIAESANVQQAIGRTPEDLRQELMVMQSWTDFEDEVRALLGGVAAANLVRRNRLGEAALAAYSFSQRLVRQKEHANLLPHVQTMKRLNRFGVKKSAKTPVPTPNTHPKAQTQAGQVAIAVTES